MNVYGKTNPMRGGRRMGLPGVLWVALISFALEAVLVLPLLAWVVRRILERN